MKREQLRTAILAFALALLAFSSHSYAQDGDTEGDAVSGCNHEANTVIAPLIQAASAALAAQQQAIFQIMTQNVAACNGDQACIQQVQTLAQNAIDDLQAIYDASLQPGGAIYEAGANAFLNCINDPSKMFLFVFGGDPLVIDINGDGFDFSNSWDESVQFDITGNGEVDQTAWTSLDSDDSFLALDRNQNGKIDDANELFADNFVLLNGDLSTNGFQTLGDFDKVELGGNEDGKITKADLIFNDLIVWKDSDHNGISHNSEMKTLKQSKITKINLGYYEHIEFDENGNKIAFLGDAKIKKNGRVTEVSIADVFFVYGSTE